MDGTEGRAWEIERVTLGTDLMYSSGVLLEAGQLFGCAAAHERNESFHEIMGNRLKMWTGGEVQDKLMFIKKRKVKVVVDLTE